MSNGDKEVLRLRARAQEEMHGEDPVDKLLDYMLGVQSEAELAAVTWVDVSEVSMSGMVCQIEEDPDFFPSLDVGQGRRHRIKLDAGWCRRYFEHSGDRNRRLHTSSENGGRGIVQGVAIANILGSVVSYAVWDAVPDEVPIRIVHPVRFEQTALICIEVVSGGRTSNGRSEVFVVRISMEHAGGTTVRYIVRPVELVLRRGIARDKQAQFL